MVDPWATRPRLVFLLDNATPYTSDIKLHFRQRFCDNIADNIYMSLPPQLGLSQTYLTSLTTFDGATVRIPNVVQLPDLITNTGENDSRGRRPPVSASSPISQSQRPNHHRKASQHRSFAIHSRQDHLICLCWEMENSGKRRVTILA